MPDEGYLLSPKNFKRLQRMVHAFEGEPRSRPRLRTRRAVFQPGAGSKVYQCVHGLRLMNDPDDNSALYPYEPAVLCVELGTIAENDLELLGSLEIFQLQQAITSFALVDETGIIDKPRVQQYGFDVTITSLVEDAIGKPNGIVSLLCRNAQGYIGTGQTVIANDTEVWVGGYEVFAAEIQDKFQSSSTSVLAEIVCNQESIDRGLVDEAYTLTDRVLIRDPLERSAIYIPSGTTLMAEFNGRPPVFDDNGDTNVGITEHFLTDDDYGVLPVFNMLHTQGALVGKAGSTITQGNSGSVTVWHGTAASGLSSTGDSITAYARYGDVTSSDWLGVTPHSWGWEAYVQPCA